MIFEGRLTNKLREDLAQYIKSTGLKPREMCDAIRQKHEGVKLKEPTIYNFLNKKGGITLSTAELIMDYIYDYEN